MIDAASESSERGVEAVQDTNDEEKDSRDDQSNRRVKRSPRWRRLICRRYAWPVHFRVREETPNDLKLSDGGGWRDACAEGGKAEAEAGGVTAVAVRCSAWLGVI